MGKRSFPRGIFAARDRQGRALPNGAKLVLSALWSYARWWDDGPHACTVFPTTVRLAELTAQNVRSTWRQLAILVDAGFIERAIVEREDGSKCQGWVLAYTPALSSAPPDPGPQVSLFPANTLAEVTVDPDTEDRVATAVACQPGQGDPDSQAGVTLTARPPISTKEEPHEDQTTTNRAPPGPDTPSLENAHAEGAELTLLVDEVLELMRAAVKSLTGKHGGPRDVPVNRGLIITATKRERATIDDWRSVIAAQLENLRLKRKWWHCMSLSTITRPKNWARLADAPRSNGREHAHAPSNFDEPERDEIAGLFPDFDPEEIPL